MLWILWAVTVWNVVFDRVLVLAGRQYVHAASLSARESGRYLRAGDWMRPAIRRGFRLATAAAGGILAVGLIAIPIASRRLRSPAQETKART
jgi:hypothetical protein